MAIYNSIQKKYLGINLTKEVKYLHTEVYKTLMKEIEDKWKAIPDYELKELIF